MMITITLMGFVGLTIFCYISRRTIVLIILSIYTKSYKESTDIDTLCSLTTKGLIAKIQWLNFQGLKLTMQFKETGFLSDSGYKKTRTEYCRSIGEKDPDSRTIHRLTYFPDLKQLKKMKDPLAQKIYTESKKYQEALKWYLLISHHILPIISTKSKK